MLDGYGGRSEQEVEVIGETPKRLRIRAITRTRLAGRSRWLEPGEAGLVPKYAVKLEKGAVVKIEGFAGTTTKDGGYLVLVNGKELPLEPSLKVRNHSPSGFCWGFGGSGPAQLALALLLFAGIDRQDAEDLYQTFKFQHVARWPNGQDFSVELDLRAWVQGAQAAGRALRQSER